MFSHKEKLTENKIDLIILLSQIEDYLSYCSAFRTILDKASVIRITKHIVILLSKLIRWARVAHEKIFR